MLFSNLYRNEKDYLRIHIRANSNDEEDQKIKLLVRDEIIAYLTPLLAEVSTKEQATNIINENLDIISLRASNILYENGFFYGANALIKEEEFPTRKYENLVLEKGTYDALIINLGMGEGDNWWCVAFPPLCFVPSEGKNIKYKSKILEIIENAKNKD